VSCTTVPGGAAKNFISCAQDGEFGPFLCGTRDGPLICLYTPADFVTFVCSVPTSFPEFIWADVDCNGTVNVRDQQSILRIVLGNAPLSQTDPCPNINDPVSLEPNELY
jgi:hypothetical protein